MRLRVTSLTFLYLPTTRGDSGCKNARRTNEYICPDAITAGPLSLLRKLMLRSPLSRSPPIVPFPIPSWPPPSLPEPDSTLHRVATALPIPAPLALVSHGPSVIRHYSCAHSPIPIPDLPAERSVHTSHTHTQHHLSSLDLPGRAAQSIRGGTPAKPPEPPKWQPAQLIHRRSRAPFPTRRRIHFPWGLPDVCQEGRGKGSVEAQDRQTRAGRKPSLPLPRRDSNSGCC